MRSPLAIAKSNALNSLSLDQRLYLIEWFNLELKYWEEHWEELQGYTHVVCGVETILNDLVDELETYTKDTEL